MILPLAWWANVLIAIPILILGAGRFTRLVTYDDFPPTIWLRVQWDKVTEGSTWNKLLHCFWCFGHWATLLVGAWFVVGIFVPWIAWTWWIVWTWFALSYLVSMLVARDEPIGQEND